MKKILLIAGVLSFIGCGQSVTIADLFEKEGCSGPCYQRMPCEGESITVQIPLDGSNILENGNMLFVKDQDDIGKTIKIEFASTVPESIKQDFKDNVGKTAYVSGHIEGYDLLNPQACKRAHIIYVDDINDVSFR